MALSPEQPLQPSLSEGQEGAKNLSVRYPGDPLAETQTNQKACTPTNTDPAGVSSKKVPAGESNLIETLQPYDGSSEWISVNRRKPRAKYRNERLIQRLINLETVFQEKPYFVNVFNIKFPGVDINEELNIIKADKEIKSKVGKLKKIVKAGKNTLLVETESADQSMKVMTLKQLADIPVIVETHKTLNQVRGIVKSKAWGKNTIEELKEQLANQGVADIQRIRIKRNGEEIQTDTYVVYFNKHSTPKVLKITDWHYEAVQTYVYQPQQCFNCQRYGHVAKYCRRTNKTCVKCGIEGHTKEQCENAISCFHCGLSHYANDRCCNKYKIEKEILATQHRERTSRIEATEIVISKIPEGERLYSTVTGKSSGLESQGNKTPPGHMEREQGVQRPQAINIAGDDKGSCSNNQQIEESKQQQQTVQRPQTINIASKKQSDTRETSRKYSESKRERERSREEKSKVSRKTQEQETARASKPNIQATGKEVAGGQLEVRMRNSAAKYVSKRTELASKQGEQSKEIAMVGSRQRSNDSINMCEENETKKSKRENIPSQGKVNKSQKEENGDQQSNIGSGGERQKTNTIQVLISNKANVS